MKSIKSIFRILGSGLITGAADDYPSGIANNHKETPCPNWAYGLRYFNTILLQKYTYTT
jgi:hypothetical protein